MQKTMKKTLSIILAILMIVTMIPFTPIAFAADDTPDFSDAKVLTSIDGALYIDGVEAETNSSKSQSRIYEGKYILEGDIETSRYIWIFGDTFLDLNGYTWNLTDKYINVNAPLSIYDTSEAETGKITSDSSNLTININNVAAGFNLYGGTIENTSSSGRCVLDVSWADVNLYAGKIKSNSQAIHFVLGHEITLNIDDTVIESGDGYADIHTSLSTDGVAKGKIDVTDYKGDSLTAKVNVISTLGKITVFKGIKDAQDAEKYQITDVACSEYYGLFWEKTEYDEATGEKSIYTANNAFTQQPSADNNFTVDFNNPAATFQWYEVEEKNLGTYIVEEVSPLFSYDFKAGDILVVSTDSELRHVVIETGIIDTDYEFIDLNEYEKTATITFDADTTVDFFVAIVNADNPVEVNFTLINGTKLDGETEKTLQNAECGKSYYCKATVDGKTYLSESVTVGHNIVSVDAQAPTCTEIGWDAYEYCTACDYTTKVEIPVDPDAHDYTNHYCKRCDKAEDGYYAAGACGANGDNLNWSLDADGVLTISGEGEMQEMFIYLDQPWKDYRRDIKEVVIEEGVTKIAEAAFYLLTNLEKVTISSTAEFEDFSYCFIGCSSLKEFIVSPANPYYCTDEYGVVFSKDKSKLIKAFDLSDVDYVIPDTVTSVAEEAFAWIKIKSIIVNIASESMLSDAEIGKLIVDCANVEAFAFAMTRIEEIVLTNKVSFIGYSAFGGAVITSAHYLGDPANLTIEANENESLTDVLHYCEHKEALAPTCTEIGWDAYEYCTACTYTTYVEKEALNHKDTLVKVNAKAPTCTEIGWDAYEYCTACDYSTYVELPAITHTDANCDYKCDYNCGYVYETLDFSDAKVLTEENGILYIDGEKAEDDGVTFLLHAGKYKLAENISTSYIWVAGEVALDLNGYVWDLEDSYIVVNGPFSVYDTSAEEKGKITSTAYCTITTNSEYGVFSLYSGTIENNSTYEDRMAISSSWASANLYGGKVKGNGYALYTCSDYNIDKTVVLGDVVLESGEGYAQIKLSLKSYVDGKKINIDVTDYTGESLETDVEAEYAGKFDIIKGVSSADEAEKYKLNIIALYNFFHEKTEYDEEAGDVNIYIAKNAFTQQPSAENCFTVDFNNPAATLQWYEVEEEIIGTYVAESFSNLFTYNFKAGDILKVSTDSDVDLAHLAIGNEYLTLTQTQKSKTIKFNADKTITVSTKMLDIEGIELEFSIIREKALDGETGKALKNPECKKSYCCKATVNGRVYNSDTVVGHEIIQVEEKAATCTETGWEAYEYCTACTYTTYVELPENGHTPLEAVKENEVAPKCDVTGSYDLVVYCDDCGAELDRDTKTVDALKHSFTKYEVTEEAKCGVAGKEVATCDNGCGATDEKAIEALKHDIVIDEAVAPKCGETGLTQGEHCTRCDYKVEQEIVPALEHKDADGDYKCDFGCGHEFEKPAPEEPTDSTCDHLCHKSGILGFFWKIVKFFSKLFKLNPVCECGAAHY